MHFLGGTKGGGREGDEIKSEKQDTTLTPLSLGSRWGKRRSRRRIRRGDYSDSIRKQTTGVTKDEGAERGRGNGDRTPHQSKTRKNGRLPYRTKQRRHFDSAMNLLLPITSSLF